MQHKNENIDDVIRQGFISLTPAQGAEQRCVAYVNNRQGAHRSTGTLLPFRMNPQVRYAIAAALLLSLSVLSVVYINAAKHPGAALQTAQTGQQAPQTTASDAALQSGTQPPAANTEPAVEKQPRTVQSTASKTAGFRAGPRTIGMLAAGSSIRIITESARTTEVELLAGTAAFDVTPGGSDTVRILSGDARFVIVGTIFKIENYGTENRLTVYRGKVLASAAGSTAFGVSAGFAWSSLQPEVRVAIDSRRLQARSLAALVAPKVPVEQDHHLTTGEPTPVFDAGSEAALIERFRRYISAERPSDSLQALLAGITDTTLRQAFYGDLSRIAQQKSIEKQFSGAERLYDIITAAWPGTTHAEEALAALASLAEQQEGSVGRQIIFIERYLESFPDGQYAASFVEKAQLLLRSPKKAEERRTILERFLVSNPDHPKAEFFLFRAATMLREELRRPQESLGYYRTYLSRYPNGRFAEEALSWTIKLGELAPSLGEN